MKMSVNFILPEFQSEITTSTVCSDGYGVQNLINFNPFRGGWKGFMAESFIKPPVDITIKFPINICIEKIVLDPCVGRQKSSGFEIYSACVIPIDQEPDNEKQESNKTAPIFTRIANTLIPWRSMSEDTCMLRFINNTYRASFQDIRRLSPQKQDVRGLGDIEQFMRLAMPGAVENVNCITIRITRSYGGSVLALRKVEVWGEPSLRIPKQSQLWALEIIRKLYSGEKCVSNKKQAASVSMHDSLNSSAQRKKNLVKILPTSNHSRVQKNVQSSTSHDSAHEETSECPEDFLDPITCQMIMLPVLLPSGHTVDRSTLEKHNATEAIWGRPPNNPFTGVAFTSRSQPVPNVKLKTRIDHYLLKSGNKHEFIARDVGRTSNAAGSAPSASTLVMPSTTETQSCEHPKVNKHINVNSVEAKQAILHPFNAGAFLKLNIQTKKAHPHSHQKRALDRSADQSIDQQPLVKKPKLYPVSTRCGNQQDLIVPSESRTDSKSHEDSLTDSLDSALNQALRNLPSYSDSCASTQATSTNGFSYGILRSSTATSVSSCTVCHVEVNTALSGSSQPSVSLYSLPCTHLICRACLVTAADNAPNSQYETRFCAGCGRTYRKEDVVRVHL